VEIEIWWAERFVIYLQYNAETLADGIAKQSSDPIN